MDPQFSLSAHLRAEKAKATELNKQVKKESKRKREEWLSMGAPAQQDYALFLEEREHEKQKRLKQEQKMIEKRQKEVKKLKKEKKRFQKKLKKKLNIEEEQGPVQLSDWKKDKESQANSNSENEGSDIEWGKPPPANYKKDIIAQNPVLPPLGGTIGFPAPMPFLTLQATPYFNNLPPVLAAALLNQVHLNSLRQQSANFPGINTSHLNAITANNLYINHLNTLAMMNTGISSSINSPSILIPNSVNQNDNSSPPNLDKNADIKPDVLTKIQAAKALAASLNNA